MSSTPTQPQAPSSDTKSSISTPSGSGIVSTTTSGGAPSEASSPAHQSAKAIRAATLLWMASVLLSRVMGFLREIVIARQVGANAQTDVYFAAFTIPDFVNYLLAGGALSITFIPIFSQYMAEGNEEEGWRVFSTITSFLFVALGSLIALAMIFTPAITPWIAEGFSAEQQATLVHLTRILLPAQMFHFQGFLLSAVQMAKGQHRYPALSPLIYNGGTILGGLLLGGTLGMEGFAWGVLGGAFLGSFVMQIYGARQVGLQWSFRLDLKHPGFLKYLKLSLPIMVGQSLVVWDEWLTRYFGSFLTAASISWLNYGRKLALVPQAVFGQAAGAASYPYLARKAAEGHIAEVHQALHSALRGVLVMALGTQVVLMVAAQPICYVLFHSGRFSESDVNSTAATLLLFSLGIGAWSMQGLVARGFYALQDTLTPTAVGTLMTLASAPLYWFLAHRLQHAGLALASTLAITLYTTVLYLFLNRRLRLLDPTLHIQPLLPFLLRLGVAGGVGFGLGYGLEMALIGVMGADSALAQSLSHLLQPLLAGDMNRAQTVSTWLLHALRGALTGGVGGMTFVVLCFVLGVREIREVLAKVLRRLPGGKSMAQRLSR